jgi:P27 family predicted phage terminase small subunit
LALALARAGWQEKKPLYRAAEAGVEKGRKPKPTVLKRLAGNPGKRPLNGNEGEPRPPVPEHTPYVPRHLNKEGRREWRRIAGVLMDLGLYTVMDRAPLAMYCQAWGRWVEAEQKLAKKGPVLTSDQGNLYQNPWAHVSNRAWEQMRRILPEFGLTPSARSRLVVPSSLEEEPSLAEMLFAEVMGADVTVSDE